MRSSHGRPKLGAMSEMHSTLDRLEARIDYQAARIDTLFELLDARGILRRSANGVEGDALFDGLVQIEDTPFARERHVRTSRPRSIRLHVGDATGV
jgi:hypothetical protein